MAIFNSYVKLPEGIWKVIKMFQSTNRSSWYVHNFQVVHPYFRRLGQITRNGPALNWKPWRTSQGKWYLYDIQLTSAHLTARWVYGTENSMRVARSQRYPSWGGLFIAHIIFLHFADSNNKNNNQHEFTLNVFFLVGNCMNKNTHLCFC